MIPNNLIQFWDKLENIPELLQKSMEITRTNNPDAKFIFADDRYMRDFITTNYGITISNLYDLNTIPASRSDIARLMLLYEFGGFYIDVSMELQNTLTTFIDKYADIILVQRDDNPIYEGNPQNAHVINGIIGAPPKSEFIKWCIQRVFRNLTNNDLNKSVHIATGPIIINQALRRFESQLNVKKLSFKQLQNEFLHYRRVPNVSNNWTRIQQYGIIEPEYYDNNCQQYEKTWVFMNKLFHISFRSISLKNKTDD